MLSAAAPGQVIYCVFLLPIGACTLLLLTTANSTVQMAAPDAIRGRVMGVYLLVFVGGAALGGPLLGLVDQHLGPRTGMLLAGAVPAIATALIAAKFAIGSRRVRTPPIAGRTWPRRAPRSVRQKSSLSPERAVVLRSGLPA